MKIHHILDDMLDSKSKVRILRLLFRFSGREFTERDIAGMIKMSPNTVNLALGDLRRTNVFLYKRIGRAHSYRCNTESILFPALKELFGQELQMREDLITLLKEGLDGVGSCVLFGSFAREEEGFDSDLDVLIVTKDKEKARMLSDNLAEILSGRFSITLAPMIFSPEEFEEKRQKKFIKEALSEGIIVAGKGLEA